MLEVKQCSKRGWFFHRSLDDWHRHRCERVGGHRGRHLYHPPHHPTIYFDDSTRNVIESRAVATPEGP